MRRLQFLAMGLLCLPLAIGQFGCTGGTPPAGGGGGGTSGGDEELLVSFDADGGNFAVAEDNEGNQYTFREDDGVITEANILMADGTTMKASMDDEGRPVKLRASDNTNADIVYDGDEARVLYTSADGDSDDVSGIDTTAAKARVEQRRVANQDKRRAAMQRGGNAATLVEGLEEYEEIIESLLEDDDSPLAGTPLENAARRIGWIASIFGIQEEDELEDIVFDETPPAILAMAGGTYMLFEAEGLCVEETGIANTLTFNSNGILLTEFDSNFVFPDFSLGGTNPGFTINYESRTPVNLTPGGGLDFNAAVTPIFTGTQLDENGKVTIERRFLANIEFEVDLFTASTAQTEQLFNAAFINGEMIGDVLEFDLILIDLEDETPVGQFGHVRYYRQGSTPPAERDFPCNVNTGEDGIGAAGINCPGEAQAFEAFSVEYDRRTRTAGFATADYEADELQYDWFVSGGFGFVEDPFSPITTVVPTGEGILEVNLIVSNPSEPSVFDLYYCEVRVGDIQGADGASKISCPETMTQGVPARFETIGSIGADVVWYEWYVFGTHAFFISDPLGERTDIVFHEPGRYEVWMALYKQDGSEEYFLCEPFVESSGIDECEELGWYEDGFCDAFCLRPDPDCAGEDWCANLGWYGDGFCDRDCPQQDTDCGEFFDECEEFGFYNNQVCDPFCPHPDPDCDFHDECAELGWYGDGVCDECPRPDEDCITLDVCAEFGWYSDGFCDECPRPDPDCGGDWCEDFGLYGDGFCDFDCPRPDMDCGAGDWCEELGWYGDGFCDFDCPRPDTDCAGGDWCADMGYYDDGFCDFECPTPDPDCGGGDWCEDLGFYGDGFCDFDCPRPDEDCAGGDWCQDLGYYGDGFCDFDCPHPDPDCEGGDWCEDLGFYGDGFCDFDCPRPDPDCEGGDWCEDLGFYGDGFCDYDCPRPDPDCQGGDWCDELGFYGDGFCDFDCPRPDEDCAGGDWCADMGYYGDGFCDPDCPMPDSDCQGGDWCADMGYYSDGFCDSDCPMPDPDCLGGDWCADLGWYGDGFCDFDCPAPDPDCEGGDWCADLGYYGDGFCDYDCPDVDPDCASGDWCADLGYYEDGFCDFDCPAPDPDCNAGDICMENNWYGDGECDTFCDLPDPDCESAGDICAENGWYGDGVCDDFCPAADPDCDVNDPVVPCFVDADCPAGETCNGTECVPN